MRWNRYDMCGSGTRAGWVFLTTQVELVADRFSRAQHVGSCRRLHQHQREPDLGVTALTHFLRNNRIITLTDFLYTYIEHTIEEAGPHDLYFSNVFYSMATFCN